MMIICMQHVILRFCFCYIKEIPSAKLVDDVGQVLGQRQSPVTHEVQWTGGRGCPGWCSFGTSRQNGQTGGQTLAYNVAMNWWTWMSALVQFWEKQTDCTDRHLHVMGPWTADGGCLGWWSTGTHIHTETLTCTWWGHGLEVVDV